MIKTARITGEWIPLPAGVLTALGWSADATVECDVVGDTLVITKVDTPPPPNDHLKAVANGAAWTSAKRSAKPKVDDGPPWDA